MIQNLERVGSIPNLDLSFIKAESQKRLFQLLDKFEGTKTIIFDDKLIGPFEFVASASLLKKHDATLLLRLSDVKVNIIQSSNTDHILLFVRKDPSKVAFLADVLHRFDRSSLAKTSLVFIPRRCASIEEILRTNQIDLSKLHSIEELNIELFVMDTDILTMELDNVYRDIYLNENHDCIHSVVESILKIEHLYGQVGSISGQGTASKLVKDLLVKNRSQSNENRKVSSSSHNHPQIHKLILIDRRVDLVSPLLTQLTYEGLLDEVFGINNGNITLPADRFKETSDKNNENKTKARPTKMTGETRKIELKSSDNLYSKLRDCHINAVADTLKQSSRKLQTEYEECNSKGITIHEMGKIVKRLQHLKNWKASQSNHLTITELLNEKTHRAEFIYGLRIQHDILQEDRVNRPIPDIDIKLLRQEPPLGIIRLICLQSHIANGLKPKISETYQRDIVLNYGFKYVKLLIQLERANLWLTPDRFYDQGYFSQLKSKFNLINDTFDERNPTHISYAYGGYSPLSVVIAGILSQTNNSQFRSWQDNLRLLPSCPTINNWDTSDMNVASGIETIEETQNIIVFFIGGCTFAEISALRLLANQQENSYIIATTSIINGDRFIQSLWPPVDERDRSSDIR